MSERDHSGVLDAGRDAIRREAAGVLGVADQLDETFLTVIDLLLNCNGKVFVTGSGTSSAIARRMAHLLSVCGTPSVFAPAMDALHGSMGAIVDGDILIAISRGGESHEIYDLARRVRLRSVPVIALTAAPASSLAQASDVVVTLTGDDGVDPGGVIAMGSTLLVAVWGDALAYVLMRRRDYGWDKVLETHPAGAVGQITHRPDSLAALAGDDDANGR